MPQPESFSRVHTNFSTDISRAFNASRSLSVLQVPYSTVGHCSVCTLEESCHNRTQEGTHVLSSPSAACPFSDGYDLFLLS